jgi:hypothetical protein
MGLFAANKFVDGKTVAHTTAPNNNVESLRFINASIFAVFVRTGV